MPSEYVKDLLDHKRRVAGYMQIVADELFRRATVHDNSKFEPEEYDAYNEAFPDLQRHSYGSPEFSAALQAIEPAVEHHYKANDHHPQHFLNGIADMDLIQLVEMVCDWLAASERSQKDIYEGLLINQRRFGIDQQLLNVVSHTIATIRPVSPNAVTDPNTLYPDVLLSGSED